MADLRKIDLLPGRYGEDAFLATRSPQMAVIPDKYLDLLQHKKAFANLATIMADGSPQVTPVWFDFADGVIRVDTTQGPVKSRALRPGAPGSLAVCYTDPAL